MRLIDNFMTPCCFMEHKRIKDGAGGNYEDWLDGEDFDAAIILDSSIEARRAEKAGVQSVYTVTTKKGVPLTYNTVFKRKKDGRYFRVTTNGGEVEPPSIASFEISQVNAEMWELTK